VILFDRNIGVKEWQHPAETITIPTDSNESTNSTQIFTDGSKSERGVGAGIAIFRLGKHYRNLQYRLNKRCTNNQAEQLAILRAMEYIGNTEMEDKTIKIFTDSQVTMDALRNNTNHTSLIAAIRKKGAEMRRTNWEVQFCWVEAHVGIQGNELADTLVKEAATNMNLVENYKKVPKSVVTSELTEISIKTWQR
jgi:ribonuclease HI